jgi:hypothetical protein
MHAQEAERRRRLEHICPQSRRYSLQAFVEGLLTTKKGRAHYSHSGSFSDCSWTSVVIGDSWWGAVTR